MRDGTILLLALLTGKGLAGVAQQSFDGVRSTIHGLVASSASVPGPRRAVIEALADCADAYEKLRCERLSGSREAWGGTYAQLARGSGSAVRSAREMLRCCMSGMDDRLKRSIEVFQVVVAAPR